MKPIRMLRTAAALFALALMLAGCAASVEPPSVSGLSGTPARPAPGTVLTFATFNAYDDVPRATVRQRFTAEGSRVEGMDYGDPPEGGFGQNRPPVVSRVLDAEGSIVRIERADGSSVTYSPPLRTVPLRLEPGARFRQQLVATESDGSPPRKVVVSGYVSRWETVRVPAGEFRAARVVRDVYLGDHQFHRTQTLRKEVDWYAPELGAMVRALEDSFHEDELAGGGMGVTITRSGDWLRWELQSIDRPGRAP